MTFLGALLWGGSLFFFYVHNLLESMMDFYPFLEQARSCRRFNEKQRLGAEAVTFLVNCARISPSARNAQVLRYKAAESPEACEAIFPHTRWAGILKWDGPVQGERPSLYIAILAPKGAGKLVHMDVGIAAQNIQLAAHSRGWGCCMHASFNPQKCEEVFNISEDMDIALLLGLGVALEERCIEPLPSDGNFNYWRDDAAVHHVPKRSVDEVLLRIF